MPKPIIRPGRKLSFTETPPLSKEGEAHLNQHGDSWSGLVSERLNVLSKHNVTQGNRVAVCTVADFPTPVDKVITLEDATLYEVCGPVLDLEDNQLVFGAGSWLMGQRKFDITQMEGNTEGPLFQTNGSSAMKIDDLTIVQNGTGDLAYLDSTITDQANRFRDVVFLGGNIVGVDGLGMLFEACVFDEGVQVIQDGSGGVSIVQNGGGSLMAARPGFPPRDGIFKFEDGSTTDTALIEETAIFLGNSSIGINIEPLAEINQFTMSQVVPTVAGAGGTVLQVGDPNKIGIGSITGSSPEIANPSVDRFLACQPNVFEKLDANGSDDTPYGMTQDGEGNLITCFPDDNLIQRYDGINDTVDDSIVAPSTGIRSLAWFKGDLYSTNVDSGGLIYKHTGFSTTTTSIASPATLPTGIVFVGEDMVTADFVTNLVYIHDGFSITVTSSFASPATQTSGIAYDGVNLLIADQSDNSVYVMRGVTDTVQYKFTTTQTLTGDVWTLLDRSSDMVGFSAVDVSAKQFSIYDNPVTFDHSSPSWELMDNFGVVESSDRGGSQFSTNTGVDLSMTTGVYTDIAVSGIAYGGFSENEKMVLNDEGNGEILWLSTRERGRIITGQITFARNTPTSGVVSYNIAIVINGIVQKDSIAAIVQANTSVTLTGATLPISRDLVLGDTVKLQIERGSGSSSAKIYTSKIAIT